MNTPSETRLRTPLTEAAIRAARPREKAYKLFDERALFLLITPAGGRLWRFKFRFGGVEKALALGAYPEVSLKRAREKREAARVLLADGIDPGAKKHAERVSRSDTFQSLATEWLSKQTFAVSTADKARWTFERLLFPHLGSKKIPSITASDVLSVLRPIESQGRHDTCHRVKQRISQVLRFAIAIGRSDRDVTIDLKGALTPVVAKHFASITEPRRVGELLRAIDGYVGQPATSFALRLAPLLFVRPGELRGARWSEVDVTNAEWRVPGERMKMGDPHIVPLSRQAIAILHALEPITGHGKYLFPSLRSADRTISEATLNAGLRRLGYSSDEQTTHGFRSMASTLLNELGWHPDLIELQLAHAERNKVRAAYNRAQRLDERRRMMQAWADYLDGLKTASNVVPIKRSA
jgi:integrase